MTAREAQPEPILLERLLAPPSAAPGGGPMRGILAGISEAGQIEVELAEGLPRIVCDYLHTSAQPPELAPGDVLLLLPPVAPGQPGLVLGRVGKYQPPSQAAPPQEVVVQAAENLTLQCGASRIELRRDGKLLIKGTDVVSRAERTQRIKGGTVAIN